MTTIADLQGRIIERLENKFKGGATKQRLFKILSEGDLDNDGVISLKEFHAAFELAGLSLKPDEMDFLFSFWDSMGGQQEPTGAVEIGLAVADLLASKPTYGGVFNSGPEAFKVKGDGKNNRSSVQGGIFGGGAYQADANGESIDSYRSVPQAPSHAAVAHGEAAAAVARPRGNQSSVVGGIFAPMENLPAQPQPSNRSNRSNQSSIQGGIFGEAGCGYGGAPPTKGNRSNQSSIPGGIFG